MPSTAIPDKPNGPVAAVLLGGGFGAAVLGAATLWSELAAANAALLNWYAPVGPLTGQTLVATAAFFLSWALLALLWRGKNVNFGIVALVAFLLLAVGLVGTFPPVLALVAR